jgi:diacylglycerol kinase (ATP)
MKDKWIFIVNPVAGSGSAKSQLPQLDIEGEIVFTGKRGHAEELSANYLGKGFRYFIAIGGDGTFNEIARPLISRSDAVAGIIPAGTGNDFIQILGFPGRFNDGAWDAFFKAATIRMDAGLVNGMIFLNGMGLGFDAQVASENYTPEGIAKEGNKYRYIWHIIKTLLFFREKRMTIIIDNERTETDCFINTIAVGRRFAGGFMLTPAAIANDGLLDICSIKRLSLPERFRILLMVPDGKHINDRRISYYQTPSLNLEFPEVVPFHIDGELYFSKKFEVSVIPEGLNVIYNPDGPHFFKNDSHTR